MFFDFSSAFNTIQPLRLKDKLARMQVDPHLVSWITNYLTGRPQYVRLKDCMSETVVSSTGAPQGTVLSPFLFTLYTSDFRYNSETCHMQKFSDDTAIVACVRGGQEAEYRNLVEDFVAWYHRHNLLLNTSKTKEMVVDFRRARPLTQLVFIEGVEVEMVRTYRYLGLHLDGRLDWKLLQMFYQTVVSSCLFYAVVCWGGNIKKRDEMRLDKLVRRAGSVVGVELDSVVKVAEMRTLHKLLSIMDDDGHPLHTIIMDRRSKFSGRLLSQSCSTDRLRRSFQLSEAVPSRTMLVERVLLIALKPAGMDTRTANIPEELWRRTHRGCRGGTKQRTGKSRAKRRRLMEKKGYKPRLPTLIMGNDIPDDNVSITGFQTVRADRDCTESGDFNHVTMARTLPNFTQYVDCPTREERTLDLLYANVKSQPVTTRTVRRWSEETSEVLQDCFETTDWTALYEPHGEDIDGLTECITDYINFCVDSTVPTRTVKCYPNNKPWVTKDIKALLNKKKRAFRAGDREEVRTTQRELKRTIREAKDGYRRKLEWKLQQNNMREVWSGMRTITGFRSSNNGGVEGSVDRANELNLFFNRFDTASSDLPLPDSSAAWPQQPTPLHPPPPPDSLPHSCDSPLHTPSPPPPVTSTVNFSADQRVPVMWKTSCIVPVPKTPRPSDIKDYRPVALTSHIMKTMERLVLEQLRPMVQPLLDPLQFAYQPRLGVEDAIIYLLNRVYAHLDKPASTVRVMFFDFSSAFNTIQPALLGDKLNVMQVDAPLVSWIVDYLTGRPQYVRLHHCVSDRVVSNTGAPQGTVLSPFLFTLYTTDFNYCTETCHLQKFSDDSAVVGCISRGDEDEYRATVNDFVAWCELNHLQLNVTKTKELVVDLRRDKAQVTPISIKGVSVDTVEDYKYLGVHIDNKLDWAKNTDALYRKGQSRLYFLRRLRSFNICRTMLRIFYESVVASAILYAVACWGSRLRVADANRLNKLIRKASDVVGVELDSLMAVSERRTLSKLQTIMDNGSHPLYHTVMSHRSTFSARLIQPKCTTERHRRV
ncbi:hypothetical protein NFI96_007437 [Prochilodus magdalenae]|nr:hypothetical protein NFI96_007437 [Prochilodus magdalenae]